MSQEKHTALTIGIWTIQVCSLLTMSFAYRHAVGGQIPFSREALPSGNWVAAVSLMVAGMVSAIAANRMRSRLGEWKREPASRHVT